MLKVPTVPDGEENRGTEERATKAEKKGRLAFVTLSRGLAVALTMEFRGVAWSRRSCCEGETRGNKGAPRKREAERGREGEGERGRARAVKDRD